MASINKFMIHGYECYKLVDTSTGCRLQYSVKLDKYSERQWLTAHNEVLHSLSPEERQGITGTRLKEVVLAWLNTPKEGRASARQTGIKLQAVESKGEQGIAKVIESYLADFCQAGINSDTAITKAKRQCEHLLEFFKEKRIALYSSIRREHIAGYPEWRKCKGCKKAMWWPRPKLSGWLDLLLIAFFVILGLVN